MIQIIKICQKAGISRTGAGVLRLFENRRKEERYILNHEDRATLSLQMRKPFEKPLELIPGEESMFRTIISEERFNRMKEMIRKSFEKEYTPQKMVDILDKSGFSEKEIKELYGKTPDFIKKSKDAKKKGEAFSAEHALVTLSLEDYMPVDKDLSKEKRWVAILESIGAVVIPEDTP